MEREFLMLELTLRILFLLRLCCFMALVYLALHAFCVRMIRRADSRVLWFFAVLTAPLTRPVRAWLPDGVPLPRLLRIALLTYSALWGLVIALSHIAAQALR